MLGLRSILLAGALSLFFGCIRTKGLGDSQDARTLEDAVGDVGDLSDAIDAARIDAEADSFGGEQVVFSDGWTGSVYWDLSAEFEYVANDFLDYPGGTKQVLDNRPRAMALLSTPFADSLAILAGRELFVLQPPATVVHHDYAPVAPESSGPDYPGNLLQISALPGLGDEPYLLLTASSDSTGDGLYGVAPDWSITRLDSTNNVRSAVFDEAGLFDGIGAPTLYWGLDRGLFSYGDTTDILPQSALALHCTLLPSVHMACATTIKGSGVTDVVAIASVTHEATTLLEGVGRFRLLGGDPSRLLGGILWGILDSEALVMIAEMGSMTTGIKTVARAGEQWKWIAAVVAPADHALGAEPAVYLLEAHVVVPSGNDIDRVRVLRLTPP